VIRTETFVRTSAGAGVPSTARKIDGVDLSPLLFGKTEQSPQSEWYCDYGTQPKAVRSGPRSLRRRRRIED